jgi:hypothetical protein
MKMKKLLAILLALVLVLSLCACGGSGAKDSAKDDASSDAVPADTGADTEKSDTADDGASEPADPEKEAEDAVIDATTRVGYFDDEVDHFARDTYHFCYCYTGAGALTDNMIDVFHRLGKIYNFECTELNGNNDPQAYVQGIEVEANKGTDGLFIDCDPTILPRVYELVTELEIPYVSLFNPMYESAESTTVVGPSVVLEQERAGRDCIQYYYDHYKEYWGEIDLSKLALLNLNFSTSPAFQQRVDGSTEKFKELFPDCDILEADGVTAGQLNAEVGYDLTSQVISAHPEYEYWIVFSCVEYYAQGATRYAETTVHPENILITCSGSNVLPLEFESGYDGTSFKVAYAVADICYGGPAAMGLIAICDGRATEETLWQELKPEGSTDPAACYVADAIMLTIDNWQTFKDEVWAPYDPDGITSAA